MTLEQLVDIINRPGPSGGREQAALTAIATVEFAHLANDIRHGRWPHTEKARRAKKERAPHNKVATHRVATHPTNAGDCGLDDLPKNLTSQRRRLMPQEYKARQDALTQEWRRNGRRPPRAG